MPESKQRIAFISMLVSGGLAAAKFVAAALTGSLGLLSEALHGLIDFGSTIVTWFAVRWADEPADSDHHFGHAKIESVAALFTTVLLVLTALGVAFEAVRRLWAGEHTVDVSWWAVGLLALSIVVDFNRSRALSRAAKETSSHALAADALHFSSDMWSSLAVIIGLVLVWYGVSWADSAAALVVSAMIGHAGLSLARDSLATLIDRAPEGVAEQVRKLAEEHQGVLNVAQLRVRPAGAETFVNLVVDAPRTLPITEVVEIKRDLTQQIAAAIPRADVSLTVNPVALDSETAFDKIALIARHQGLAIHHLVVQDIAGRLAVSFDLEVDGAMSLRDAHDRATKLENDVRDSLGPDIEVESHIEPLPERLLGGTPASPVDARKVETQLKRLVAKQRLISDLHNVRVRFTDGGLAVHYHCRLPPQTNVNKVHETVDRIEDALKAANPLIWRVVAHTEPVGEAKHRL